MTSEHDTLLARVDRDAKFLDQCARDLKDNNGRAKQLRDMASTLRACKARILRYEQQRREELTVEDHYRMAALTGLIACKGFTNPKTMTENLQILTQAALASRESRGGV